MLSNSPVRADSNWYSDGSKTDYGVGAEIYEKKPRKAFSVNASNVVCILQVKVAAIHHYVREIERCIKIGKSDAIFSNVQAALKMTSSATIDSKLLWDYVSALNKVGTQRKRKVKDVVVEVTRARTWKTVYGGTNV